MAVGGWIPSMGGPHLGVADVYTRGVAHVAHTAQWQPPVLQRGAASQYAAPPCSRPKKRLRLRLAPPRLRYVAGAAPCLAHGRAARSRAALADACCACRAGQQPGGLRGLVRCHRIRLRCSVQDGCVQRAHHLRLRARAAEGAARARCACCVCRSAAEARRSSQRNHRNRGSVAELLRRAQWMELQGFLTINWAALHAWLGAKAQLLDQNGDGKLDVKDAHALAVRPARCRVAAARAGCDADAAHARLAALLAGSRASPRSCPPQRRAPRASWRASRSA